MQQTVCVRRKKIEKNAEKSGPPKNTHHEIHSSPATATASRRRETKHVPRVSPYSPASIDPEIVDLGPVQLSPISKNDERYTHAHTKTRTHTDRPMN